MVDGGAGDRLALLLDDQHTDGAVTMDDPDADQDGGIEQVEAHAEGAQAAGEAACASIDLRRAPAGAQLAEATLDPDRPVPELACDFAPHPSSDTSRQSSPPVQGGAADGRAARGRCLRRPTSAR
ncbi:hypothetical protein GCM10014715_45940 [Streptomyces spiralis]|uniref:Uncharacterized protein n=1 Tax=Streptomyces spiralis TaxID=66376 RepID=A0A919A4A2_9ACTN|nr:hypothetical protein GCM10014715_45940 [Streptomyces spiralis]